MPRAMSTSLIGLTDRSSKGSGASTRPLSPASPSPSSSSAGDQSSPSMSPPISRCGTGRVGRATRRRTDPPPCRRWLADPVARRDGDGRQLVGPDHRPRQRTLHASSANRDRVFVSDPTSTWYGPLTELINTGPAALISPTGLLLDGDTLYVGFYGPWNVDGQIATFNASTGN